MSVFIAVLICALLNKLNGINNSLSESRTQKSWLAVSSKHRANLNNLKIDIYNTNIHIIYLHIGLTVTLLYTEKM